MQPGQQLHFDLEFLNFLPQHFQYFALGYVYHCDLHMRSGGHLDNRSTIQGHQTKHLPGVRGDPLSNPLFGQFKLFEVVGFF